MKTTYLEQFRWVPFKEHNIVDILNAEPLIYDIITNGNPDFSADFMKEGEFSDEQYCFCLLEKLFSLSGVALSNFLDYQLKAIIDPFRWRVLRSCKV